jgi:hypothetical protein
MFNNLFYEGNIGIMIFCDHDKKTSQKTRIFWKVNLSIFLFFFHVGRRN